MIVNNKCLILLCLVFLTGCAAIKERKLERMFYKGSVIADTTITTINFTTLNNILLVPLKINGVDKKFLLDTGAAANILRTNDLNGQSLKVSGASKREVAMTYENVKSIKIGAFDFADTFTLKNQLEGMHENVDGFIGQPIIKRANWLINYPKKELSISTQNLADSSFQSIEIKRDDGAPYTLVTINDNAYKTIIDTGSRSVFSIPLGTPLADELLKKYSFKETERETWTIGGSKIDKELIGILPKLSLGEIHFENVEMIIKETSQLRIGMAFFKDYSLYIDNNAGDYKIKKHKKNHN